MVSAWVPDVGTHMDKHQRQVFALHHHSRRWNHLSRRNQTGNAQRIVYGKARLLRQHNHLKTTTKTKTKTKNSLIKNRRIRRMRRNKRLQQQLSYINFASFCVFCGSKKTTNNTNNTKFLVNRLHRLHRNYLRVFSCYPLAKQKNPCNLCNLLTKNISDLKRRMSSWGRLRLRMSALRQCFSLTLKGNHKKTSSW